MDWTKLFPKEYREAGTAKLKRFGFTMAVPLALIAGLLFWKHRAAAPYWAGLAVLFAGLGLVLPRVLRPLYVVWMTLAYYFSFVMSYVILTLFFFLIMTPVSIILRVLGKDPMHRRFPGKESSYWVSAQNYENTIERYSKPY
jgi:hypothetical protein